MSGKRPGPSLWGDILSQLKDIKLADGLHKSESNSKGHRGSEKRGGASVAWRGQAGSKRGRGSHNGSKPSNSTKINSRGEKRQPGTALDEEFWSEMLDQLSSQSYPDPALLKEDAATIVVLIAEQLNRAASAATSGSAPSTVLTGLARKFCEFLVALFRKQEVAFHLSAEIEEVCNFLLRFTVSIPPAVDTDPSFSNSSNNSSVAELALLRVECLKALGFVVFEHGWLLISKFPKFMEVLIPFIDEATQQTDRDLFRMAVNCLGNICAKAGNKASAFYPTTFTVLSNIFSKLASDMLVPQNSSHYQQHNLAKSVSSLLRALQIVILEGKSLHDAQFASLISVLTKLMYYGTPNLPPLASPASIPIGTEAIMASSSGSSANNSARTSPASSEYSGSDANGGSDRFNAWKVRLHALGCLQSIAKCSGQKFIPYWPNLLPQSSQQPSICSILLSDPVHQVRSGACTLLSVIIDGQKSFLAQTASQSSTNQSGFTSMSARLAAMLREIHHAICRAIDAENRPTTLVQIIKCVAVVVSNTPYENLQKGLLTALLTRLTKLYNSSPHSSTSTPESVLSMHRSALSCLAAVISAVSKNAPVPSSSSNSAAAAAAAAINSGDDDSLPPAPVPVSATTNPSHSGHSAADEVLELLQSSILATIMQELKSAQQSPLHPELLRVLASVAGSFFELLWTHWKEAFTVVLDSIQVSLQQSQSPSDPAVTRLFAVKVLEEATGSMLRIASADGENSVFAGVWDEILHSSLLLSLVTDRSSQVRSTLCNIMAQIPATIFSSLKPATRIMCITLMLGAARDESPVVRAQACRTLGIYILNSSLNIDPIFVTDVAVSLVEAMKDPNLTVRIRACWSLANLCDALVGLREGSVVHTAQNETEPEEITEDIPKDALILIAQCALVAAKDNDKVRSNAVRALGNFTRFASKRLFSEEDNTYHLFTSIIKTLIEDTREGSAKVRWNACYALGNLFKNEQILEFSTSTVSTAIDTLLNLLASASNFKIRINACVALASPPSLAYYTGMVDRVWKVTLDCLESIESLEDVASYQYKDTLHEQLIRVTLHLVGLMTKSGEGSKLATYLSRLIPALSAFWSKSQGPHWRRAKSSEEPAIAPPVLASALHDIQQFCSEELTASPNAELRERIEALIAEIASHDKFFG